MPWIDISKEDVYQPSVVTQDARLGELGTLRRPDGGVSTELSITVEDGRLNEGRPTNIPLLVRGQQNVDTLLAGQEATREQMDIAIRRVAERVAKGAYLPSFSTVQDAVRAARERSEEKVYGPLAKEREVWQDISKEEVYGEEASSVWRDIPKEEVYSSEKFPIPEKASLDEVMAAAGDYIQQKQRDRDGLDAPRLTANEQIAIVDAFRQQAGIAPKGYYLDEQKRAIPRDNFAEIRRARTDDPWENFKANTSGTVMDNAANLRVSLAKLSDSMGITDNAVRESTKMRNEVRRILQAKGGASGFMGQATGNVMNLFLAMGHAPGMFAGSAAGDVFADVSQRRAEGQQIGAVQEWTSAIGHAAVEYTMEMFGQAVARKAGGILAGAGSEIQATIAEKGIRAGIRAVAVSLGKGTIRLAGASLQGGMEEGITEVLQNGLKKATYADDQKAFENVGQAFLQGAVMPIMAAGPMSLIQHSTAKQKGLAGKDAIDLKVVRDLAPTDIERATEKTTLGRLMSSKPLQALKTVATLATKPVRVRGLRSLLTRYTGLDAQVRECFIGYEEEMLGIDNRATERVVEQLGEIDGKKVTDAEERLVHLHVDDPAHNPLPEYLQPIAEAAKNDAKESAESQRKMGETDFEWPYALIRHVQGERAELTKAIHDLGDGETEAGTEMRDQLRTMDETLGHLSGLGYMHRITVKPGGVVSRLVRLVRPSKKVSKSLQKLRGRKFLTIADAEEAGFEVAPLRQCWGEMIAESAKRKAAYDLIDAINSNPELSLPRAAAPEDWVRLDRGRFPSGANRAYNLSVADAVKELTYVQDPHAIVRTYDKINSALKLIGFYNPLIMTKNDLFQGWRAGGIKFFAEIPKAIHDVVKKTPLYERLKTGGLFSGVVNYQPALATQIEDMIGHIRKTKGERIARHMKKALDPRRIIKNIGWLNNVTTWKFDEVLRTACYRALNDGSMAKSQDMNQFEIIELANDFMANYGKVPKATRKWANRFIFTPTYRISMARMLAKMFRAPAKFWPQLTRHLAWKLFVWFTLPKLVGMYVAGKWNDESFGEMGYRIIIPDKFGEQHVFTLADPLLEMAKFTQRPIVRTLEYNMAALPHMMMALIRPKWVSPEAKKKAGPFSPLFKLGTPFYRDLVTMMDEDKPTAEKIVKLMALAYSYHRKKKPKASEHAVESLAKALSVWTNWREQVGPFMRAANIETGEERGRRSRRQRRR